jgi:gliding motility-associated-like protein
MASLKWYPVLFLLCILASLACCGQAPGNDNCANAYNIPTGSNYKPGTYNGTKVKLKKAGVQPGESFPALLSNLGLNKKTVWYKFTIGIRRSVSIELKQNDTMIDQNAVGFAVYKYSSSCPPNQGQLDNSLAVLTKFGSTTNTCLAQGTYLVQVCGNNHASDSVWIKLDVRSSSPAFNDQGLSAWRPGVLTSSFSMSGDATCLTNDSANELCPAIGPGYKDYNKTAWAVFKTDSRPDFVSAYMVAFKRQFSNNDSLAFAYILYEGDAANGSQTLKIVDGPKVATTRCYSSYCNTVLTAGYACKLKPNTLYSIQLFFHKDAILQYQLQLGKNGQDTAKAANPKSLPKAYQFGVLAKNKPYKQKDVLACNAHTELYACGSSLPPYEVDTEYVDDNGVAYTDTFDLNTWCTFVVTDSCQLMIANHAYDCLNEDIVRDGSSIRMMLYKGDITKSCNLPLFYKGYANALLYTTICLAPGVYSYKLIGRSFRRGYNYCSSITLGVPVDYTITISDKWPQYQAKFYKPALAEDLGDITDKIDKGYGVAGTEDFAVAPDDTITIDHVFLGERMSYRQFYISHDSYIRLQNAIDKRTGYTPGYMMRLFQGKVTDGVEKLKQIPAKYFGYSYPRGGYYYYDDRDSTFFRSGCIPLPAGWYTVVGNYVYQCNANATVYNNIIISPRRLCPPHYNHASKASLVNNLQPLVYSKNDPNTGSDATYSFPDECFACENDLPFAAPPCKSQAGYSYTKVAYYVFKLSKPVYARFRCYSDAMYEWFIDPANFRLFNFDIRKDSALAADTTHQLKSCNQSGEFCNLQPGTYTLAVYSPYMMTIRPSVYIDSITTSKYDYASNAGDMGLIPGNGVVVNSNFDIFSCSTGAEPDDPDTLRSSSQIGVYYDKSKSSVPYPIAKNQYVGFKPRTDLWYTFTVAGTGHVKVQAQMLGKHAPRNLVFSVYKSSRNGAISFAKLKSSGKIDSTIKQGLEFVGIANYEYYDSVAFDKPNCDTARYFVIVDQDYTNPDRVPNYSVRMNVGYVSKPGSVAGDFCSNAILLLRNGIGKASRSVYINCHTAGEGFGEDGSNMGCLSDSLPFKTTWFKVSFTATQRSDLTFNITANTSVPPARIRYRVLYGDCNAMTPGPCISNTYTTFTLNCMPSGDYYVQVAEPEEATGTVQLNVTATPADYPLCKPANLFQPLANFFTTGGCNSLPVSFQNLSTQGEDIVYHWDFGNGEFSTERSPVVHYKARKQVDTFHVTLTVRDTVHDAEDTLTQSVVVYRDPVTVNAGKDTAIECGNAVQLNAICNYPYAIYQWTPATALDNPYSSSPVANPETDTRYVVSATVGGCTVFDTVMVKMNNRIPIYGGHFLCPGGRLTLTAAPGYQTYYWNNGKYTRSIVIDTPGIYSLFTYYDYCKLTDTFRVYSSGKAPHLIHDTVVCNGDSVRLNAGYPELGHLWSTGDTGQYTTVTKDGSYTVTLSNSLCSITDTITVHFDNLDLELGHDTAFCSGFEYLLDAGNADAYVWNTGETTQKILATKPGKYIVKVKKSSCSATDSVSIGEYPVSVVRLGRDTSICDTSITLDAGPAVSYYWLPGGQNSRRIRVSAGGTYSVLVTNKYGCQSGDTIVVVNDHCYPTLFVPNSFTPNGDGENDFFRANGEYITSFKMEIFNRWGERIFRSDDIAKGWDGRFKGEKAQMDVYLWMIEYTGYRTHKLISGNVTLLR